MYEQFDKNYHLVQRFTEAFGLNEDQSQDLALYLWERCIQGAENQYYALYNKAKWLSTHSPEDNNVPLHMLVNVPDPSTEAAYDACTIYEDIDTALNKLTQRESKVIRYRFGLGETDELTLELVGKVFHVNRERARQIEAKAIRKLRHKSRSGVLKCYVGTLLDVQSTIKYVPMQIATCL